MLEGTMDIAKLLCSDWSEVSMRHCLILTGVSDHMEADDSYVLHLATAAPTELQ
jgi:hypothetical protein